MLMISVEVTHTTRAKKATLSDMQYYAQAHGRHCLWKEILSQQIIRQ